MVDIVDKQTRSRMMAGIKSQNTKPERLTRAALHRAGFRFRLDSRVSIKGQKRAIRPDIVLRKHKVAIFVHSCFFHQHEGCKLAYSDRNYSDFWLEKFKKNKERDARTTLLVLDAGYRVAIVWECVTRKKKEFEKCISALDRFVFNNCETYFETTYREK